MNRPYLIRVLLRLSIAWILISLNPDRLKSNSRSPSPMPSVGLVTQPITFSLVPMAHLAVSSPAPVPYLPTMTVSVTKILVAASNIAPTCLPPIPLRRLNLTTLPSTFRHEKNTFPSSKGLYYRRTVVISGHPIHIFRSSDSDPPLFFGCPIGICWGFFCRFGLR